MNNKGFAITTILFGVMILFCLLLVSLLSLLSIYKGNVEKLIENSGAAREAVTMEPNKAYTTIDEIKDAGSGRGIYCLGNSHDDCKYVSNGNLK